MKRRNGGARRGRWLGFVWVLFSLSAVSPCEQEDKTKGPTKIGIEGGVEKGPNGSEVIVPAGSLEEPIEVEIRKEPALKDLIPPEGAEVFSDVLVVRASRHVFSPRPTMPGERPVFFQIKIPLKEKVTSGENLCATEVRALYMCDTIESEPVDPEGKMALLQTSELYGPDSPVVIGLPGTATDLRFIVLRRVPAPFPQAAPQRASLNGRYFRLLARVSVSTGQVQTALSALDGALETYRRSGFLEPLLGQADNLFAAQILPDTSPPCAKSGLLGRYDLEPVQDDPSRARVQVLGRLILCARSLADPSLLRTTAAHELFHAIQFSYFNWGRFQAAWQEGKPLLWLTEGSAEALAGTAVNGGTPRATDDFRPLSLKDSALAGRICESRQGTACYQAQDYFVFLALSRTDPSWNFLKQALKTFSAGSDAVSALETSLSGSSIPKSYLQFAEERAYRHAYKIHAGESYTPDSLAQDAKLFTPSLAALNQPFSVSFPEPLTATVLTVSSLGARGELTVSLSSDQPDRLGGSLFRELAGLSVGGETISGLQTKAPGFGTSFTRAIAVVASASPAGPVGNATVTFSLERETGTITGTVSGSDGKPLSGVKVTTSDGAVFFTASTGADGRYTLEKVPAGQRVVTASLSGRKTTQEARVIGGGVTTLNFALPVSSTSVTASPVITLNDPNVDQAKGLATITGTIKNMDSTSAVLIHNGEETLISVVSSGSFSRIIILRVGENIVRVRATNAVGTSLSDPITISYSPTATAGKMALRTTLVWDTETDQDLHVWTPSGAQIYFVTDQADGGELDVDNIRGFGPENVTFPVLKEGRYAIGVDYFGGSAATNVIVRVSVNEGTDFQQTLSFGPQLLTKSNHDGGYPVTATTESWWRVADVVVGSNGVARIENPGSTPLKQVTARNRLRKQ